LAELFRSLGHEDQLAILRFAEFLAQQQDTPELSEEVPLEPERLPRPAAESVVHAIKRLSRSYHMLDRSRMLTETSSLMAAHVLNGRPAEEVIDELEGLFARYYAEYKKQVES
jgi:hypothetical protein